MGLRHPLTRSMPRSLPQSQNAIAAPQVNNLRGTPPSPHWGLKDPEPHNGMALGLLSRYHYDTLYCLIIIRHKFSSTLIGMIGFNEKRISSINTITLNELPFPHVLPITLNTITHSHDTYITCSSRKTVTRQKSQDMPQIGTTSQV